MKKFLLILAAFVCCQHSFSFASSIEEEKYPAVILGGGVGALTSATYLSRAGIQPLVITGQVLGGAITYSSKVQNWPGEIAISGDELSEKLYKQAEHNGAVLRSEVVISVDVSEHPFTITTKSVFGDSVKKYTTDACIIAMGSTPKLLNVPGESKYWTHGVYTCAVCDGSLYKDKIVAVVGGGDSALIEAQYLCNLAKKVYILVRGQEIRALEMKRAQEVLARPNVEVMYDTTIEEMKGDEEKLTQLVVRDHRKNAIHHLPANALFLAIGATPNSALFCDQLECDEQGYILLKKNQMTSVEGVYAIGDIADPEFKQAVSAAGDGAKAAMQIQRQLLGQLTASLEASQEEKIAEASIEEEEIIDITSRAQFERELKAAKGAVFVDFYSTRCGPCRTFSPLYDSWAKNFHGKIKFLKVSTDAVPELFDLYRIHFVPTLAVFDGKGQLLQKCSGSREIAKIEKCLQKVKDKPEIVSQDFKNL